MKGNKMPLHLFCSQFDNVCYFLKHSAKLVSLWFCGEAELQRINLLLQMTVQYMRCVSLQVSEGDAGPVCGK